MNLPADLKYTKEHEWIRIEDNIATVGISEYAQSALGDITFVELPEIGMEVEQFEQFAQPAHVGGKVVHVEQVAFAVFSFLVRA